MQIMYKYALRGIWKQKRHQLLRLFRHHGDSEEAVQQVTYGGALAFQKAVIDGRMRRPGSDLSCELRIISDLGLSDSDFDCWYVRRSNGLVHGDKAFPRLHLAYDQFFGE
jgi:hypothetical protein